MQQCVKKSLVKQIFREASKQKKHQHADFAEQASKKKHQHTVADDFDHPIDGWYDLCDDDEDEEDEDDDKGARIGMIVKKFGWAAKLDDQDHTVGEWVKAIQTVTRRKQRLLQVTWVVESPRGRAEARRTSHSGGELNQPP